MNNLPSRPQRFEHIRSIQERIDRRIRKTHRLHDRIDYILRLVDNDRAELQQIQLHTG